MFILIKYLDNYSYGSIFNYLKENFNFIPKIIHSDFEGAIAKAISENKYFGKNVFHSRCFFHLAQMIRHKLEKLHICTKKLNKQILEIIRNIELLCFIKIEKIKAYKTIILEKLNEDKKYNKFINYLNRYLFKIDPNIYNYDKFINYKKEQHNNKYLKYLFTTNNVVESINAKLNYYLTKGVTTNTNFVNSITKFLINDTYEENNKINIKRHDYITKTFLKILDSEYFKEGIKWIKYDDFVDFEKTSYKRILSN